MIQTKVALVTGAATGIGRACAERLAQDGLTIAANYRSKKDEIDRVMAGFRPGSHMLIHGDIADPDIPQILIDAVVSQFGRLDVLVNAAGTFAEHEITTVDYKSWLAAL